MKYHVSRSFDQYLREIGRYNLLTGEQEQKLGYSVRTNDSNAQESLDKLIKTNLRYVVCVAKKYSQEFNLPLDDLTEYGNLGLITGIKRFDERKGYRLISYATWWIRQSILFNIMNNEKLVRIPSDLVLPISRLKKDLRRKGWTDELNLTNLLEEIIEEQGLNERLVETFLNHHNTNHSLDESLNNYSNSETFKERLTSKTRNVKDFIDQNQYQTFYDIIQKILTPKEQIIIDEYYGLTNKATSLRAIGKKLNLSRERIRQIREEAFEKIRMKTRLFNKELDFS